MKKILVCALVMGGLLAGCGDSAEEAPKPPEKMEILYNNAYGKLATGQAKEAAKDFDEVERQYPYSDWARRSVIMSGFSSYQGEDFEAAVASFERYVKLYPDNESTPYAYYMIALSYYEQISDVGRDQKMTEQALNALREVVRRFPDSEYARDAKIKVDLTVDHLAGKEMAVGRYYLQRDDYLSAINRFKVVVENYQTTTHVAEALHRLVECYLKLGIREEAQRYASVLGHNYPASLWYRDSYALMTSSEKTKTAENETESSWWDSLIP
ncbi:MAG: outer membrane protein assembly factor BamD [Rickettsiales bacterium]|nr:outer membrane protein assembly factor BamD [Rickettsiales bacterium]